MNDITLNGCTPVPLAGYLKALGVLRLLSATHPDIRGLWCGNRFVLSTSLDRDGIIRFFHNDYEPTPVMAPWNGGSGFYENDNKNALNAIKNRTDARFVVYRTCLTIAEKVLAGMDRRSSPKGAIKLALLARLRAVLPDAALEWFDASISLAGESAQYPPLLGTGGNDGRLDFTNNFMQRLLDVFPAEAEADDFSSSQWLVAALFSDTVPGLSKNAIGQFSPGQAGGPNSTVGFGGTSAESDARTNPWDFVLMIEGALVFASATSRRNADDPFGVMSYPFTVRAVGAGAGSTGEADVSNARGELWLPLWSQPASFAEVQALMAEGRVALGKKPARDALDFIRAVHHLGGYRGVRSFQRFGLLMRSGKAYLATPLGRVDVAKRLQAPWLDDLEKSGWLSGPDGFRHFAQGMTVATRFRVFRKRLEDKLFALSGREPHTAEAQDLLILLGEIQMALSASPKARESVRPVPDLSWHWVAAADDGTPAFRIAKALAGLQGVGDEALPLRAQIFPLQRRYRQWMASDISEKVRIHTDQRGLLTDTLRVLLERRLWLAQKLEMNDKPLTSPAGATANDVAAFLRDDSMDARIATLLPGLCLCEIPEDTDQSSLGTLPAAYGLIKLALTPDRILRSLDRLGKGEHSPMRAGMVAQLASGNSNVAQQVVQTAWRRLRASDLTPTLPFDTLPSFDAINPLRAVAALLIPLRYSATATLARQLLETPGNETAGFATHFQGESS